MTNETTAAAATTTDADWDIDVPRGKLDGVSGYQHFLVVHPEDRTVRLFTTIGAGCPISVWNRLARSISLPLSVDGEMAAKALAGCTDDLDIIADAYLGQRWDGHNHTGTWSEDTTGDAADAAIERIERELAGLPTYWDAGEWLAGGGWDQAAGEAGAALAAGRTLSQWAGDVAHSALPDALVDEDEVERVILDQVEHQPELLLDRGGKLIPGAAELAAAAALAELPEEEEEEEDA